MGLILLIVNLPDCSEITGDQIVFGDREMGEHVCAETAEYYAHPGAV